MIDATGEHPPHPELHLRLPLIQTLLAGTILYRHHQKAHNPVLFGATLVRSAAEPSDEAQWDKLQVSTHPRAGGICNLRPAKLDFLYLLDGIIHRSSK